LKGIDITYTIDKRKEKLLQCFEANMNI